MTDKEKAKELAEKLTEFLQSEFDMPDLNIAYAGSPDIFQFRLQFTNDEPSDTVTSVARMKLAELTDKPIEVLILGRVVAFGSD